MESNDNFDLAAVSAQVVAAQVGNDKFTCVSSALPSDATVTMAYVPFQLDRSAYSPEHALRNGTLFKCLDKPFKGRSIANE